MLVGKPCEKAKQKRNGRGRNKKKNFSVLYMQPGDWQKIKERSVENMSIYWPLNPHTNPWNLKFYGRTTFQIVGNSNIFGQPKKPRNLPGSQWNFDDLWRQKQPPKQPLNSRKFNVFGGQTIPIGLQMDGTGILILLTPKWTGFWRNDPGENERKVSSYFWEKGVNHWNLNLGQK